LVLLQFIARLQYFKDKTALLRQKTLLGHRVSGVSQGGEGQVVACNLTHTILYAGKRTARFIMRQQKNVTNNELLVMKVMYLGLINLGVNERN
jgi:hypothetical protein